MNNIFLSKGEELVRCQWRDCQCVFQKSRQCLNHVRYSHNIKNLTQCFWGTCTFKTCSKSISHHLKRHFDVVDATCQLCSSGRNFKWRFDLKKHLEVYHLDTEHEIVVIELDGFLHHAATRKSNAILPKSLAFILD